MRIVNKLFILLALVAVFTSCNKTTECNSSGVPTVAEIAQLKTYLTAGNINATLDPQGFYYEIVNPGTGLAPTATSTVKVRYTGKLFNGSIFDQNVTYDGATLKIANLIAGWQKGLKLIKEGGEINLYLPPSLGYGCSAQQNIPANSYLIFNIQLIKVL